ncbi:uncharacterized protein LOC106465482 [Limulus polyphemus]|uniref:Uncharacterized protein LOC106465482 n=1 Tax=Limulus polyphemus TaxID=6850 RepID=A0ABM1SZQ1_LIMPO|nr:uncharacterized protein LOC106465482 [Limulus polyphemus]XP_022249107.1 uncharacterized protein LOC106465482 [Limulus polyphemus]
MSRRSQRRGNENNMPSPRYHSRPRNDEHLYNPRRRNNSCDRTDVYHQSSRFSSATTTQIPLEMDDFYSQIRPQCVHDVRVAELHNFPEDHSQCQNLYQNLSRPHQSNEYYHSSRRNYSYENIADKYKFSHSNTASSEREHNYSEPWQRSGIYIQNRIKSVRSLKSASDKLHNLPEQSQNFHQNQVHHKSIAPKPRRSGEEQTRNSSQNVCSNEDFQRDDHKHTRRQFCSAQRDEYSGSHRGGETRKFNDYQDNIRQKSFLRQNPHSPEENIRSGLISKQCKNIVSAENSFAQQFSKGTDCLKVMRPKKNKSHVFCKSSAHQENRVQHSHGSKYQKHEGSFQSTSDRESTPKEMSSVSTKRNRKKRGGKKRVGSGIHNLKEDQSLFSFKTSAKPMEKSSVDNDKTDIESVISKSEISELSSENTSSMSESENMVASDNESIYSKSDYMTYIEHEENKKEGLCTTNVFYQNREILGLI